MTFDPFDPATVMAFRMNDLVHAHTLSCSGKDEVIYEDHLVIVECRGGQCYMTGKPFTAPFTYCKVEGFNG